MSRSPAEIKQVVRRAAGLDASSNGSHDELPEKVKADIHEDARKPSRVAPSAEGPVTFAGLTRNVREWLAGEIAKAGSNGNGRGTNGRDRPPPSND